MSNFFNVIGVADMEKVHSAVIGWMVSDKCDAFGPKGIKTRSKLLQDIFRVKASDRVGSFDSIESHIEWKNIDILIVTTRGPEKKCWLIENKIKSSQHSDQLNRYVKGIGCKHLLPSRKYGEYFDSVEKGRQCRFNLEAFRTNPYCTLDKHYCFLTLIDEKPVSAEGIEWKGTKYSDLYGYLSSALKSKAPGKDSTFLVEYLECVKDLSDAVKDFLRDHREYPNVFTDAPLQKEDKSKDDLVSTGKYAPYICENNLETIFQKCFLGTIIPKTNLNAYPFRILETHGTALVDFFYKVEKGSEFGIQFQNGTFKITIVGPESAKAFSDKWKGFLSSPPFSNGWKLNLGGKNYLSLTKRIARKDKGEPWYTKDVNSIVKDWNDALKECLPLLDEIVRHNS